MNFTRSKTHRSPIRSKRALHLKRAGATATEFAIVLPMFLLLVFACCDFARVIHFRQLVANAARVGATHGALNRFTAATESDWRNDVVNVMREELAHLTSTDPSDSVIDVHFRDLSSGVRVVETEVTLPFRTVVQWPVLPTEIQVHHHAEFHQFR
jgi:Flp pilus assembly protein TadG